jgi:ribosomal protein S12 methylthiotransferase accessory factor
MERAYKMDSPSNTVNRIRTIFNKMDLMTYEEYWKDVEGRIFSCGISLEGTKYLKTLGKGMSRSYCLASGYGELIERIQNLILFTGRIGVSFEKVLEIFPDTVGVKDLRQLQALNSEKCKASVAAVCRDIKLDPGKPFPNRVIAGQFYDVRNDEVVYLPYSEMMRGVRSNGMCAGNTFAEAVTEGICELLERMAIKEIFDGKLAPPTIPPSFLRQFPAYKVVAELARQGVTIDFKDCSLGKGYPVLGILVTNKNRGEYKYNFGAHPVFNRAMERCLGEICQVSGGVMSVDEFLKNGLELDLTHDPYGPETDPNREFVRLSHFYRALKNSNGQLPLGFFTGPSSYEFTEWKHFEQSASFEEDIKVLLRLFQADGKFLFVRDVSFLNFPAYYVYITECSPVQVDASFAAWKEYMAARKSQTNLVMLLAKIKSCNDEEITDLINYFKLALNNPKYGNEELENNWIEELLGVPVRRDHLISLEYLLAMLYVKVGDYEAAYSVFLKFFNRNCGNPEGKNKLTVIKEYLYWKKQGYGDAEVQNILLRYRDENTVRLIGEALSNRQSILADFQIMDSVDNESYRTVCRVFDRIKPKVRESKINQSDLRKYFWE